MVSNPKFAKLDGLKAQVRTHLAEYIKGFVKMGEGNFCCINPLHDDKNPSCGIVKGNRELFHCFSCGAVGDIFVAANMLEQKPLKGAGFLAENLFYLVKTVGMRVATSMIAAFLPPNSASHPPVRKLIEFTMAGSNSSFSDPETPLGTGTPST